MFYNLNNDLHEKILTNDTQMDGLVTKNTWVCKSQAYLEIQLYQC